MALSRRELLSYAAAAGVAMAWGGRSARQAMAQTATGSTPAATLALPWEQEIPLREAAKKAFVKAVLPPRPAVTSEGQGTATQMFNPSIRTAIWGPSHRITLSLLKNDVWDRRITQARYPTVKEVVENATAPGASAYQGPIGVRQRRSTRPNWGMLMADGLTVDPLRTNRKALMKVTGQIILGLDELEGAKAPEIAHLCANGVARMSVARGEARADVECAVSMETNVFAIRVTPTGLSRPVTLRVYRNNDTRKDGVEPCEAGMDGRYFWIRQKLPAEKTFPDGFEYVMLGCVDDADATLEKTQGRDLGTPSPNEALRNAEGSAATASFVPRPGQATSGFVAVVSTVDADGGDVMAEARRRVDAARANGFDGIAAANARWYGDLYDRREIGRTFRTNAAPGRDATENIADVFYSWFSKHGGGTKTDMRKYQASAHYCVPETEPQAYSGLPCYNEVFYTDKFVRGRGDSVDMWKQLIAHWTDAARKNAREVFDLPGMYITHGFLPPVKPDVYVHSNFALEFAVDTMAQMLKPVWDEWDYGGDETFLRDTCYPLMREMCLFYAGYVKKEADGKYHIVPCMQEESWGFYPGLSHNRDCIAALCMFKWALLRTSEAAKLLQIDADLWPKWTEIAENIAPYPTWEKPEGLIFAGLPGVEPWRGGGEHPWDVGSYPALLADEINLDSDSATKDVMERTVRVLQSAATGETLVLIGRPHDPAANPPAANPPAGSARPRRFDDLALGGGPSPERLLNSRSGRIHLFPCAPATATAFRKFQARGGFLVSASRDAAAVTYVEIESRRNVPCRLMNPWPGRPVQIRDAAHVVPSTTDTHNGECITFAAQRGHRYTITTQP
jgi:hypothetical protein